MKSLEVLDFYLEVAEEMEEDKFKNVIKNNLEQIKSDLEVLEILKKLFGDMEINVLHSKRFHKTIGEIRFGGIDFGFDVEDFGLTLENLLKLKQWLKENNYDN